MEKYDAGIRGDCPGLDGGQVSTEHEKRFKNSSQQSDREKNTASLMRRELRAQNNAKEKGIQP